MKKTITAATACLFLICTVSAQEARIGFTGGAAFSNFKAKSDVDDQTGNAKTGLTLGTFINIAAGYIFNIQPGLHWTQKGTKDEESMSGTTYKVSLTNNYIEVPVNFLYTNCGFLLMINFNQGFSYLVADETDSSKIKSHYFGVRLGYLLQAKK